MAGYEGIGPVMDSYDASVQLHPKHEEEKQPVAEGLAATKFVLGDKQALANLLKLWVADTQSRRQKVNLDSNEEIVRLIPILCGYFSREELVELLGENMLVRFLEMHRAEMLQSLLLEHELQHILHAFNQAHIPIILFKGPVLAHTVYSEVHLRTYHDFDILIKPQDLTRAHDLLVSMGYANYEEFLADAIDSKRASYNYVLKHPGSWLEVLIELHTAPHPGQGGVMFEPEAIWAGAQHITILDEPVLTMGVIDHLLYLCWHYRFHGFTRLNWLFDIVQLLRASEAEIDWNALVQTARHLRLATNLYYCLLWCRNIFGVPIPEQVIERLFPPLLCRVLIERVAMPDAAKALASAQWRSRKMFARRAMVDNPFDLIASGIHTLFPRPAVLGRRYMNKSRLPLQLIFLFYLIHPPAMLLKGCHDLWMRSRRHSDV